MATQEMDGLMGANMPQDPMAQPQAEPAAMQDAPIPQDGQSGPIDIQPILEGIEVPPNLKPMYDKIVLSGMRIMFSKGSHQLFTDQLDKEGPLAEKIASGIVALMYMLWTQSNKNIPPQLIIPATVALTARAFDYVQKTGDPEATSDVLGQAIEGSIDGVLKGFGGSIDGLGQNIEQGVQGVQAAVQGEGQEPGAAPMPQPGGGLMDAMGGQNG